MIFVSTLLDTKLTSDDAFQRASCVRLTGKTLMIGDNRG